MVGRLDESGPEVGSASPSSGELAKKSSATTVNDLLSVLSESFSTALQSVVKEQLSPSRLIDIVNEREQQQAAKASLRKVPDDFSALPD